MDPDTALFNIVGYLEVAQERRLTSTEGNELAELVTALDGWLCEGGFLPKQWQR